jgi:8-oxo-dGTP pyrophosphatase MutT (NUDIX family)
VLYIRRTAHVQDPHGGQVAFPGGASDPGDANAEATALREVYEEIGVHPLHIRLLGRLIDFVTVTSYRVTPIIGVIPWPYPLVLETNEVDRAFTIPLDWLADPYNHEARFRPLPNPYEPIDVIYFKPYDNEILWGASARFTMELINLLSRPTANHVNK